MSADPKLSLKAVALVLSLFVGVATLLAFASPVTSSPARLDAAEQRIGLAESRLDKLESDRRSDRELLVRIDENVKALKEAARKP